MAQTSNILNESGSFLQEGPLAKRIERQAAKIPNIGFLGLAIGAMAISAGLELFSRRKDPANFVGLWVPTILLFGIYNKLVKHDEAQAQEHSAPSYTH